MWNFYSYSMLFVFGCGALMHCGATSNLSQCTYVTGCTERVQLSTDRGKISLSVPIDRLTSQSVHLGISSISYQLMEISWNVELLSSLKSQVGNQTEYLLATTEAPKQWLLPPEVESLSEMGLALNLGHSVWVVSTLGKWDESYTALWLHCLTVLSILYLYLHKSISVFISVSISPLFYFVVERYCRKLICLAWSSTYMLHFQHLTL